MKHLILLFVGLLVWSQPALARNSWQGQSMTVATSAACAGAGENIGAFYTTHFFPSGISDNGTNSFMTFYGGRNAFSIKMAGRPAAGVAYSAIYINSYGAHTTLPTGTIVSAAIAPAAFTETTPFLNITIRISNWTTNIGCTVTLQSALVLRR